MPDKSFSVVRFSRNQIAEVSALAQAQIKETDPDKVLDGYIFEGIPKSRALEKTFESLVMYPVVRDLHSNIIYKIQDPHQDKGDSKTPISVQGYDYPWDEELIFNTNLGTVKGQNKEDAPFSPLYLIPNPVNFNFVYFEKIQIDRILYACGQRSLGIQLSRIYVDNLYEKPNNNEGKIYTLRAEEWLEYLPENQDFPNEVNPKSKPARTPAAQSFIAYEPIGSNAQFIETQYGVPCPPDWWQIANVIATQ